MKRTITRILLLSFLLIFVNSGQAQIKKILKKVPKKIPGIESILRSEPPISTSIQDAVTEIPFLDDFNPQRPFPMTALPRTSDGDFFLDLKGHFLFECKSYCLRAGTYAPDGGRGGKGYVFAPLRGTQADIVHNILVRSYIHPEIPQRDIQVLLWAILSRTKVSKMSRPMQIIVAKLLTKEEIFKLNGGALGLVPEGALRIAIRNMPPAARRIYQAEASMRRMLTSGIASFNDLERVAVLQGDPPPEKGDREVPRGRWSYHPNGYFIRYFPRSYSQTVVEIYVPELFQIDRDEKGRIEAIADMEGNRIETEYDDSIEPLSVSGESSLKGYAFRTIRFKRLDPDDPDQKISVEWRAAGWTFLGVPEGRGKIANPSARFSDANERYKWCNRHKRDLDRLNEGIGNVSGQISSEGLPEGHIGVIMSIGYYAMALEKALNRDISERKDWASSHFDLVKKAWQYEVNRAMGIHRAAIPPVPPYSLAFKGFERRGAGPRIIDVPTATNLFSNSSLGSSGSDSSDSSGGAAQPGENGRQRLALSPNETDNESDCQGTVGMVKGDVKINGKQVQPGDIISDLNGAVIETGEKSRIMINAGENVQLRFGSETSSTLNNPCGSGGSSGFSGKLMRGRIYALISRLVGGSDSSFSMSLGNSASGVRGELHPLYSKAKGKILLASLSIPVSVYLQSLPEQEEQLALMPGEEEIEKAHAVFMAVSEFDGAIHVEAIKGVIKLKDSSGAVRVLKAGQSFTKKSKLGYDPADLKRIYIIVD